MRDYKLTIEYKHLKQHCPGGVYLVPSLDDIRHFHGVIFVRRGAFTNGIFKFILRLPPAYNDVDVHPKVTFSSYVYNPHVHPETGEVDIKVAYPRWDPHRHYLVTILTYLKKIFYVKDYNEEEKDSKGRKKTLPNPDALRMAKEDPEGYRRRVQECVRESQRGVFLNNPGCTVKFVEEEKSHEILRHLMKQKFGSTTTGNVDDVSRSVTREGTLEIIKQAASRAKADTN